MASVARYCCCGGCTESASACSPDCSDITYDQYSVTFSGVQFCSGCLSWFGGTYLKIKQSEMDATVNATHVLTNNSFNRCRWAKEIALGMEFDEYSDAGCTTRIGDASSQLTFDLRKTGSDEWRLRISDTIIGLVFDDTFTGDGAGICATVPNASSELTAGGCGGNAGYSGSATIVCV